MNSLDLLRYTLARQFLLTQAGRMEVVSELCGLQAQFANNSRYSLLLRANDFSEATWDTGLIKIWTHRNTMHLIRADELGLYLSAKDAAGPFTESFWGIPVEVKPFWAHFLCEQIANGIAEREALKDACRRRGMDEALVGKVFNGWGGLLKEMSDRGMIAYAPGTQKRFILPPKPQWMDRDEARTLLVRRYFTHYGPATAEDCAAFFGYPWRELRPLLRQILPSLQEQDGYYYTGELAPVSVPRCLYLTGFDPLIMGYKNRDRLFKPRDRRMVINEAGIVFPTILYRNQLRARWKKTPGRLTITPFYPLSNTAQDAMATTGRRLFNDRSLQIEFTKPLQALEKGE